MIVLPKIDPVAVHVGPHPHDLDIHWYGLMYLIGFYGCWYLAIRRGRAAHMRFTAENVSDLLFFVAMGVILGGRIGYTFFYNLQAFLQDPVEIFRITKGGMSFHGGLLGVIFAVWLYARLRKRRFFEVMDFAAVTVPFGLLMGRIGNFINGELWGAPTDLPWGMVFPTDDQQLPRHPSMLYEGFLEGFVTLCILWWFSSKPRPPGAVCCLFLLLYGTFRILVEFVRMPDKHIGYLAFGWVTEGMVLSVPMLLVGGGVMAWTYARNRTPN